MIPADETKLRTPMTSTSVSSTGGAAVVGVTFLGDFLRPDGKGRPGGADRLVAWLCNASKRQIALASGLTAEPLSPATSPGLAAWATALRPAAQADALWASIFARLPSTPSWTEAIQHLVLLPLRGQFCVGYEMPPYLTRLLDDAQIPYLDMRVHPVRFMDDLLLAARASHPATQAALTSMAVPEGEVIATVGLREAMCRLLADSAIPARTLLVLGQRRFDATQIVSAPEGGAGFFDAADHRADIAAICARHRGVLLKPHPLDAEHSLLEVAREAPNLIGTVPDNLYRLLALPEISAVLSVSSSAAYEARYFGKTVYTLGRLPVRLSWRGGDTLADTHASLDDVVLSVDFWRKVLAPHVAVSECDGMRLSPKPNRLRIALDSFWNYQEIDTDRIPSRAA